MNQSSELVGAQGPTTWENWREWDRRRARVSPSTEGALFSDAHITDHLVDEESPYHLLLAFSTPGEAHNPAVVARIWWALPEVVPQMERTDVARYHGGDSLDEIASLVALGLGIRCRAAGVTRAWWIEEDPYGRPVSFDVATPYLPPPGRRGPLLPGMVRTVNLADLQPFMDVYRRSSAPAATAIIRAARLYEQAVWIADDSPNLSWLYLVSAGEVAAGAWSRETLTPAEALEAQMPRVADILRRRGGEELLLEVAGELSKITGATAKFVSFMDAFAADVPPIRPPDWGRVDWGQYSAHMRVIYDYRSKALHAGTPFPAPMCEPPTNPHGGIALERPFAMAASTGDGVWTRGDTPMYLAHFEYLMRSALQKWWLSLAGQGEGHSKAPTA